MTEITSRQAAEALILDETQWTPVKVWTESVMGQPTKVHNLPYPYEGAKALEDPWIKEMLADGGLTMVAYQPRGDAVMPLAGHPNHDAVMREVFAMLRSDTPGAAPYVICQQTREINTNQGGVANTNVVLVSNTALTRVRDQLQRQEMQRMAEELSDLGAVEFAFGTDKVTVGTGRYGAVYQVKSNHPRTLNNWLDKESGIFGACPHLTGTRKNALIIHEAAFEKDPELKQRLLDHRQKIQAKMAEIDAVPVRGSRSHAARVNESRSTIPPVTVAL